MTPTSSQRGSIESGLLRVVVGYRIFGAVWLTVLAVVTLAGSSPPDRPGIVVAVIGGVVCWTGIVLALSFRRPDALRSPVFVVADVGVAAAALIAAHLAGSGSFAGGYPLASVFHGVYAAGWAGGLGTAAVLTAVAFWQVSTDDVADLTASSGAVLVYGFAAAAASWAVGTLRHRDELRAAAEAALADEQTARAIAEERARLAAQIHDGVLQTLALIQRDRDDASRVAQLARRQERELREVLYGGPALDRSGFRGGLVAMGAGVEELSRVKVDVVVVGDRPWDAEVEAAVLAAREAAVNAAKHSGAGEIAVYGEADAGRLEVFVRDRGTGFDADDVADDRRGIVDSIVSRIGAVGGAVHINSTPASGTEVHLMIEGAGS
jgi:signal transduction histidine kinase